MSPSVLRLVYAYDRLRWALFRLRLRHGLALEGDVSPNLRWAKLRVEPGGRLLLGPGVVSERKRGNHVWVQRDAEIRLERSVWLRTECGENRLTAFPGGRIHVGARSLLNGAMLHAKAEIRVGDDALIGFGSRIFDADMHDLDLATPERIAPVRIGSRVWIGSDVTILCGVTIGDDVVIGARSVVTKDVPSRSLAFGQPARVVREIGPRERNPGPA
jgi:maltose O-acetyltransferase